MAKASTIKVGRWTFPKNLNGSAGSAEFEVDVDAEALVALIGRKALANRKGTSKLGAGAIVVRVVPGSRLAGGEA